MTRQTSGAGNRPAKAQTSTSRSGGDRLISALLILGILLIVVIGIGVAVFLSARGGATPAPVEQVGAIITALPPQVNVAFPTLPPLDTSTPLPAITASVVAAAPTGNVEPHLCDGLRAGLFSTGGGTASVAVFNEGADTLFVKTLLLEWPPENGRLLEAAFGDSKIAAPDDPSPATTLPDESNWIDGGNRGLAAKANKALNFKFANPASASGYTLTLTFENGCQLIRADNITDTPSPTPTLTLTPTFTATQPPTNTVTPGPSPTATLPPTATFPALGPTFTPGCAIVLTGFDFNAETMTLTVSNREAAPVTLVNLRVDWGEKELDLIRLGGVLIWNAEDFKSPTLLPKESGWLGPGRTVDPGQTVTMELVFENGNALRGVYHSVDMTFDNGCYRSISD